MLEHTAVSAFEDKLFGLRELACKDLIMALSITIELSDNDLRHFHEVLLRAQETAGATDAREITNAAQRLLVDAHQAQVPDFISQRLKKLDSLINMVHDEAWSLPEEDRKRVLTALTYFADPKDVIPDSVPVVGYLDDAIMIELCVRELKHEVEAYEDFCSFRAKEAESQGLQPGQVIRADWLADRRLELYERMKKRRMGDLARTQQRGEVFRFA